MMEPRKGDYPQIQFDADFSETEEMSMGSCLRVIADAVVGGGFDLRSGQLLDLVDVGEYAKILLGSGACELVPERPSGFADLI